VERYLPVSESAVSRESSASTRARVVVAFAIGCAALAVAACSAQSEGDTVAKAGDSRLGAAEVRELLDQLPANTRRALRSDKVALERFVRAELARRALLEEATSADFDSDPNVARQLQRVRDDALVRLWLAKQATVSGDYPSEEDLKLAYQSNTTALTKPAQYRIAQIFIAAPNGIAPSKLASAMRKAAEVGSRIPGGDFAALAREYSEHAESAARGGDVGLLDADNVLPEIVAAVRDLDIGASAGPIKTSQGLHYVRLLEKRTPAAPTYEEAEAQLRAALRARRAQELEQAHIAQLNARLDVAVDEIALAQIGAEGSATARQ
jgi:peptidylprolyl isomerase